MSITIWHNPRCGKSRQTLELLRGKGIEPTIREYLKDPPSRAEVETLIKLVGGEVKELIRDGEPEFKKLGKKKADLTSLKIRFTATADAQPGVRDFRIATPQGVSTVGQLVVVRDPVPSGANILGRGLARAQADRSRVRAAAVGQRDRRCA